MPQFIFISNVFRSRHCSQHDRIEWKSSVVRISLRPLKRLHIYWVLLGEFFDNVINLRQCSPLWCSLIPCPAYLPGGKLYSSNISSLAAMRGPHFTWTSFMCFLRREITLGCGDSSIISRSLIWAVFLLLILQWGGISRNGKLGSVGMCESGLVLACVTCSSKMNSCQSLIYKGR